MTWFDWQGALVQAPGKVGWTRTFRGMMWEAFSRRVHAASCGHGCVFCVDHYLISGTLTPKYTDANTLTRTHKLRHCKRTRTCKYKAPPTEAEAFYIQDTTRRRTTHRRTTRAHARAHRCAGARQCSTDSTKYTCRCTCQQLCHSFWHSQVLLFLPLRSSVLRSLSPRCRTHGTPSPPRTSSRAIPRSADITSHDQEEVASQCSLTVGKECVPTQLSTKITNFVMSSGIYCVVMNRFTMKVSITPTRALQRLPPVRKTSVGVLDVHDYLADENRETVKTLET